MGPRVHTIDREYWDIFYLRKSCLFPTSLSLPSTKTSKTSGRELAPEQSHLAVMSIRVSVRDVT